MIVVTQNNLDSALSKNMKEILSTNSNSTDVKSTYSKKSTLPIITYTVETRQLNKKVTRSSSEAILATFSISCIEGVYGNAMDLRGLIRALIKSEEMSFAQYNMSLHDISDNYTTIARGEGRVHNGILTVQFVIL